MSFGREHRVLSQTMLSVVKKDSPAVPVKKSSTYEKKKASDDRVMSGSPTDNRQNQRRLSKWIRTAWRIVGGTVNIILCLHRNTGVQIVYKQLSADIGPNHPHPMCEERDRNSGGDSNARSHTSVCEDTTEVRCVGGNGVPEREEQPDDR